MKRAVLFAAFGVMAYTANSQEDYNKWSIGFHVGGHDAMAPSKAQTRLFQIHHYDLNLRWMFNNRIGVMLDGGYDFFDFYDVGYNTNYARLSLQGVVNAGDLLRFDSFSKHLGMLIHGGAGVSSMWQKDKFPDDRGFFDQTDDMINFIFGVTPQIKLGDRASLNADLSFIFHNKQDWTYDMQRKNPHSSIDGYMINLSVGATFYLGKHKTHADWTPTERGQNNSLLESRLADLESRMTDSDNDGVPDYRDEQADTPEGSYVNSKGEALPEEMAENATETVGSDRDNDGVADTMDDCPDQAGSLANNGCPEIASSDLDVMSQAADDVHFKTASAVLTDDSKQVLNGVVTMMKDNPAYKLRIEGHADNVGSYEDNLVLSKKRADAVKKYLTDQGIAADRISTDAVGEEKPTSTNETEEGRALNRRVNFLIVHKL